MAFSGTVISHGSGVGIAIATGDATQIGALRMRVTCSSIEEKPHVLKQNDPEESRFLALIVGVASLITFFVAKFQAKQDTYEAVTTALVVS